MVDSSLEIELREGLVGLDEVKSENRFEVLGALMLGALLKRFGARCVTLHLISAPNHQGDRQVRELLVRHAAGQRPSNSIDLDLLESLGVLEIPQLIQSNEPGAPDPILSYSLPLLAGERVLFLIEGDPVIGFPKSAPAAFRSMLDQVQFDMRDFYLITRQSELIEELESRLENLEEIVSTQDLEIDQQEADSISPQSAAIVSVGAISTVDSDMKEILSQVERLRETDLSILIHGETGTGKELLARALHDDTARSESSFEIVSCGSLAPSLIEGELFGWRKGAFSGAEEDRAGVFERASGGTVLLDEVGDLPLEIQQKLLRVLQEGALRPVGGAEQIFVNVRVIASTRHDLQELVKAGQFREDLYYRLAGFILEVPPLRERSDDIPLLVKRFISEMEPVEETPKRFSKSAIRELMTCPWPGNIQQLKNVVQQAILTCDQRTVPRKAIEQYLEGLVSERLQGDKVHSTVEEVLLRIPASEGFNDIIAEVERLVILTALQRNRGNKSRVTKQLKIPRQTLYNKIDRYGIEESEYK
ncbi:MAG: sigma-54 dependent transcriptional regulator [Planctomycetota bacterium]